MKTIICILACLLVGGGVAQATVPHYDADEMGSPSELVVTQEHAGAEVCHSFKEWPYHSIDHDPCDVLYQPRLTGATVLEIGTLSNTIAQCYIPSPQTEIGKHFVIHCTKQ